jgi:hypothetical protein
VLHTERIIVMDDQPKKRNKFRSNVRKFVDSDYKKKLSPEDLSWLNQFENEYYANALNREGSIHRTNLTEEQFKIAKKETFDSVNAQNRDTYAIASTSANYLKFIDDDNNYYEPEGDISTSDSLRDPQYAFKVFLDEVVDEINSELGRDTESILLEFGRECVKLGASLRKDKINTAIRKQKTITKKKVKKDIKK